MSAECSDTHSKRKLLLYRDLFCRICLQYSKGALIPIDAEIKKTTLLDMFIQLTTIEHEHNDAFPRFMCEQCVSKLTLAYSIREEFIAQTELLLKLVVQKQIIKYYEQFPLEERVSVDGSKAAKGSAKPAPSSNPANEAKASEKILAKMVSTKRKVLLPNVKPEQLVMKEEPKVEIETEEAGDGLNDSNPPPQEDFNFADFSNDWDSSSTTSIDEDDWSYSLNPITPQKLAELTPARPFRRKYPNAGGRKRAKQSPTESQQEVREEKKIRQNQFSTTTCYICDTKHESIEQRDDHFRHHIHMLPYECTECIADPPLEDSPVKDEQQPAAKHIVLRSVIQLNSHMMMHTMPHKCEHCYRRFTSTYLLHHHTWNYHEHSKEGLTCEWCGKRYYTRRPFQEHVRRHKQVVAERFKCETCGRTFGSNALLRRHIMVHTGERNHKCTYCPRRFSRRCNLLDHLRLHTGERCHKCSECPQTFNSKASLEKHQRNYHSEHAGAIPPKGDRNIYTLQSDGSRLYRCKSEGCTFTSVSSTIMTQHRLRHNKPCVCEECGQRFVAPKYVRKHMNLMHSGKPRKPYQRTNAGASGALKEAKEEIIEESSPAELSADDSLIQEVKLDEEMQTEEEEVAWPKVKDNIIRTEWNAGDLNVVREYLNENTIANMLERLLGAFRLEQTPNLPDGVCPRCVTKLDYAYHVQKELVRNEHRLRHYQQEGNLLSKLFEYQTQITVSKATYTDRMMEEHGDGLLAERIMVDDSYDAPNMREAESTAATLFDTLEPPAKWAVVACDCPPKPAARFPRRTVRPTSSVRPPKQTLLNRRVLRTKFGAENPTDVIVTPIDPCKCYICNTVLETEEAQRDHLVEHVNMLPHTCPQCSRDGEQGEETNNPPLTSLAMLQRHYRMHSYPLQCPHCPQRFRKHASIYAHVRYRHELFDNPEGYTCDICGVTMRYRPSFRYHMRIHYHEQMGTFKCQYCERVFGTRARLERHERVHTGERPYACHLCPKTFIHSGQLATHISRHNNERGHLCAQCGKAFLSKAMLRQHQESHETHSTRKVSTTYKMRPRPCQYAGCNHLARTYHAYYLHRLRHEMAHRCDVCGRRFARDCEMRRHRRIYHSSEHPFKCEQCSKTFLSSQSYREHMDSHANLRRFECDICDKKFVRRRNLVNHRMSHSNARPYRCEDCDSATFKYKSDLNRHRKDKHGQQAEQEADTLTRDGGVAVAEQIVLLNGEDPVMDGMLIENVPEGILINEDIKLDGTYGEVIETVEESIVVEQPIVSFVSSDEFCRICLLRAPDLKPLLERVDGVMIPEMLYKLCGRQIEVQDGYPRSICQRCFCQLDCAYRFLNEFHQQDERLRSFYWSGCVAKKLQEYQPEGNETVHKRMGELMERHSDLFDRQEQQQQEPEPAKEMCNKQTNTSVIQPTMVDASTATERENVNLQLVKTEEDTEDDTLLEHYVVDEENEESYLDYSIDSTESMTKEEQQRQLQVVEMKIDVLQSVDDTDSCIDEKPRKKKISQQARYMSQRRREARVQQASPETAMEESIPTDTDNDQTQGDQVLYEETDPEDVLEEGDEDMFDKLRCYICDANEPTEELLENHLDMHSTMLPYECTGIKKLDAHKQEQHLTGKELEEFLEKQSKRASKRQASLKDNLCPYPNCNYVAKTYGA
uniref:Zinc finger protein Xfin n=1 Tax=Anopheles stephensi TaxID=30069 RepID=A0A182Y8H4_ANOST